MPRLPENLWWSGLIKKEIMEIQVRYPKMVSKYRTRVNVHSHIPLLGFCYTAVLWKVILYHYYIYIIYFSFYSITFISQLLTNSN